MMKTLSPQPARAPARPDWSLRLIDLIARRLRGVSGIAVLAVVAAWFALPALFVPYSEGFQPEVVLNAQALRAGDLGLGDTLYPLDARFFLLTRLGTTLGVMGLQSITGLSGLDAFRIMDLASLAVLLGTLLLFLAQLFRVPVAVGLLCCILFPPIFETASLPNDNMPSAALGCLALLLFWTRPSIPRTVATGLLLGLAALVRLDALLVAPAFAILLLTEVAGWPARILRAAIAGALVLAVPVVAYRLCGVSFLDTFAAVGRVTELWGRPQQALHNDLLTLLRSVTVMGGIAGLLGAVALARGRRWRDLALVTVVPLLYVVAYRSQLVEGRYLLPVSPFILLAMSEGLRSLVAMTETWRRVATAGLAAGFIVWIVPPPPMLDAKLLGDDEGPRFVIGRAWNPLPTLWWQARLHAGEAAIAAAIEQSATRPHPVIVTGYWTADRVTTLLLLEHGFALQPGSTPAACQGIAETFVRGPVTLLQIRTHIPFLWNHDQRFTWEHAGLACLRSVDPGGGRVLLVDSGPLDRPALHGDGIDNLFSAGAVGLPPLAPRLAAVLSGASVSDLDPEATAAALAAPGSSSMTPAELQAVGDANANRAVLLR